MKEDVKEKYGIDLPLMPTKKERLELAYANNCWSCGSRSSGRTIEEIAEW